MKKSENTELVIRRVLAAVLAEQAGTGKTATKAPKSEITVAVDTYIDDKGRSHPVVKFTRANGYAVLTLGVAKCQMVLLGIDKIKQVAAMVAEVPA